jgi:inner membrane protein
MVKDRMPSPLGHALAGLAAAWGSDLVPGRREPRTALSNASFFRRAGGWLTLACVGLAMLPDLDLATPAHRSFSHSIGAVILVTIIAAAVTGWVTRRTGYRTSSGLSIARVAAMCGLAYATHVLLDWLAVDTRAPFGLQALWPFSKEYYLSGANLFPRTERRAFLSTSTFRTNLIAFVWELAFMLPIVVLLWRVRVKALAGLASEVTGRNHAAQ